MIFGFNDDKSKAEVPSKPDAAAILSTKADVVSPALAGAPTVPTAGSQTKNTQIANTAFARAILNTLYPVGTILFLASTSPKPNFGTWTRYKSDKNFIFLGGTWPDYYEVSAYAWRRTA